MVVYFADSISKKKRKMETWRYGVVPYLAVLGLIAILMMLEPHLSGTILIVGTGIVMMIVGGIQRWLWPRSGRRGHRGGAVCAAGGKGHHSIR